MTRNLPTGTVVSQFIDHLRHNARRASAKMPSAKRIGSRARATIPPGGNLRTEFGRLGARSFVGHVVDTADLARRYVVQLLINGIPLQHAVADQYDEALARDSIGDGCYGFCFMVSEDVLSGADLVEARIANSGGVVGEPVHLHDGIAGQDVAGPARRGVRWIGGLRFHGWVDGPVQETPRVIALIDGVSVAESHARNWHRLGSLEEGASAVPAFDLHLPERFADGRVRSVRVVDETGQDLPGSPLGFVAFREGLERALSELAEIEGEQLRGELFDRLVPSSLPMSQYADWLARFFPARSASESLKEPVAVVFIGEGDEARSVGSLKAQTRSNWVAAALPPTKVEFAFECKDLTQFLERQATGCDLIVFALCGTTLDAGAVDALAAAYQQCPDAVAIYADFSIETATGEAWPVFLPAYDYERMLEQGCGALLFATRRQHLKRALETRPSSLFHIFHALARDPVAARNRIVHLPGALGVIPDLRGRAVGKTLALAAADHLRMRGVAAEVVARQIDAFPSARVRRRPASQSVSVIIPTRNQVELLRRCHDTIAPAVRRLNAEIIVVDNDSSDPDTLNYLLSIARGRTRVIRVPGHFNFSRLNNVAASAARGDHLCLLNNDIEALDDRWLDEMLGHLAEPDVGAVGATLLWPNGVIQHAGVVLGPNLGAMHAFTDRMHDDPGYGGMLTVARECSAVTAACLLTRKKDYLAVGGMDEIYFPVNFNDVDLCLKLRALGRRIVVSPDARLLHLESASRGSDQRPDRVGRLQRELRALRARWLESIVNDSYYSPLLSLDSLPFSALAWPPRNGGPRTNQPVQPVELPPGL